MRAPVSEEWRAKSKMACTCEARFEELTDYIKSVHNAEHPQAALIAILHYAQERYGYLSKEIMDHVSCETEIPTAEIYGSRRSTATSNSNPRASTG